MSERGRIDMCQKEINKKFHQFEKNLESNHPELSSRDTAAMVDRWYDERIGRLPHRNVKHEQNAKMYRMANFGLEIFLDLSKEETT